MTGKIQLHQFDDVEAFPYDLKFLYDRVDGFDYYRFIRKDLGLNDEDWGMTIELTVPPLVTFLFRREEDRIMFVLKFER